MAQANLGTDLALEHLHESALSIYRVRDDRGHRVGQSGRRTLDFATIEGRHNLGQALAARLLTPLGELAPLGHPVYGSRLHEVVGRVNTATTHNLAKLFVIEALKQERRIEKILAVTVSPHPVDRFLILIAVSAKPVGSDVAIDVAFTLEI